MGLKHELCHRATALAFKISPIRKCAARELAASLSVIADVGVIRRDYPSREQWVTGHSPLLRERLDEISDELVGEAQEEIKRGLRLLRPYAVKGFKKARFGSRYDGGYVILDDFRGIDTALSFGI